MDNANTQNTLDNAVDDKELEEELELLQQEQLGDQMLNTNLTATGNVWRLPWIGELIRVEEQRCLSTTTTPQR